uniref:SAE2 domain-containing protein n=1 Tax=Panagrellus redivivus TaxID=6233 RepID=A0A7E4VUJ6_PANRE
MQDDLNISDLFRLSEDEQSPQKKQQQQATNAVDMNESIDLFADENDDVVPMSPEPISSSQRTDVILCDDDFERPEEDDDEVELVAVTNPRKEKLRYPGDPFFVPPKADSKPKTDLASLVRRRDSPVRSKPVVTRKIVLNVPSKTKRKAGKDTEELKPDKGQLTIDAHLAWKDGKPRKVTLASRRRHRTPPPSKDNINATRLAPIFKTPSPKRPKKNKTLAQPSPMSAKIAARLQAALNSPTVVAKKANLATNVLEAARKDAAARPRCAHSRALMQGFECTCCSGVYDNLGLTGAERQRYIQKHSHHRGFEERPPTPEHYWDIDAPTAEEQRERGYVVDSESPLFKKRRKRE